MPINPNAHGNYSQGGFKGKASKSGASWNQNAGKGGSGGRGGKSGCCFAAQAVKAVWAGKFRLAKRYAVLDVKARLAGAY